MEKTDIQFEIEGVTVNCRAVGILINNKKILFQKRKRDNFWALPGGKIAVMEKGYHAVKRELNEELGLNLDPQIPNDLLDVKENFFNYDDKKFHEFIFMYSMELPENSPVLLYDDCFAGTEKGKDLVFKWLNRDDILTENIAPSFMVEDLVHYVDKSQKIKIIKKM